MRDRIYTYIQLIMMILYILRPVMPYIDYAINKDFIVNNLCVNRDKPHDCCNGKCYLEKQIKTNTENNDSKQNGSNKKIQNEEINEFVSIPVTDYKLFETGIDYLMVKAAIIPTCYAFGIFNPPRQNLT